jgi:predicted membrane protein
MIMNRSRMFGGFLLIALGLLFLLDSMDVMEFGEVIRTYWPLILIYFGVRSIAARPHPVPVFPPSGWGKPGSDLISSETMHQSAVFGNLDIRMDSRSFAGGTASTIFGDQNIDLTAATLREGQSLLKLTGVFGSVRVQLPPGAEYAVSLTTVFGSLTAEDRRQEGFSPGLQYQTAGYPQASRTLMIIASQVFGDINVRTL